MPSPRRTRASKSRWSTSVATSRPSRERALTACEAVLGADALAVADARLAVANTLNKLGRFEDAVSECRGPDADRGYRVDAVRVTTFCCKSTLTLTPRLATPGCGGWESRHGGVRGARVAKDSVARLHARAQRRSRRRCGRPRQSLASTLLAAGAYAEALREKEAAVRTRSAVGGEHADVAAGQANIGVALFKLRRFCEAANVLRGTLQACDDPDVVARG